MSSERKLQERVKRLYDSTQEVLDQCTLENGAIIAAQSSLEIYPSTAESYLFFWGRDAAFQLKAQAVLDKSIARDKAIKLARWLHRIPHFSEKGTLIKRYAPNGALDVRYGEHYQPDQAGALISAFDEVVPESQPEIDDAIILMADGLTESWNGRALGNTQDLWENRETSEARDDVFTYSLATVINGLGKAARRIRNSERKDEIPTEYWEKALSEMTHVYHSHPEKTQSHYRRKIYPDPWEHDTDNTLDASLSGLVYPFAPVDRQDPNYGAIEKTVLAIHRELYQNGYGVKRYLGDTYDGIVRSHAAEANAGTWPLLTFWLAIALKKIGKVDAANDVFYQEIEALDILYEGGVLPDNLIPEQRYLEPDKQGKGVMPLAWSHAMLVLAAETLEIIRHD